MPLDVARECVKRSAEVVDGPVRVVARASTHDLGRPAMHTDEIAAVGIAYGETRHRLTNRAKPVDAGPALPGALPREIGHDPG